ncbi:MAG: Flp pilus assembly protein CpaB [Henriciella sp.]|nr:Flp pilus assembly protein CpaB [Henriciella sp.]
MRMSPAISLGASAVLGLAATYVAWQMTKSEPKAEPEVTEVSLPVENEVSVVVASDVIVRGDAVTVENVTVERWPESKAPYGYFSHGLEIGSNEYAQRLALTDFQPGDPILDSRLSPLGTRASLAGRLEPGYRAYTVRMDDVRGVAGFVLPGDKVDVLFTQDKGRNARTVNLVSEVLLQNVEVLAVDSNYNPLSEDPRVFARATLAVNVEDAKKLSVASGLGDLSLALRGSREPDQKPLSMPAAKVAAARTPPRWVSRRVVARRPADKQIKVMLGTEESEVKVPTAAEKKASAPTKLIPAPTS